ncbi:MAG TPA: hypothetical protein VGH20_08170, partial [Myxococcales bacterium]
GSTWQFKADGQAAENLEERIGPRIYSRVHEMADVIEVIGADKRLQEHEKRFVTEPPAEVPRAARPLRG